MVLNISNVFNHPNDFQHSSEDIKAGLLATVVLLIGGFFGGVVVFAIPRIKSLRSSFGFLLLYREILGFLACLNMTLFFFVGLVLDIQPLLNNSEIFGNFAIILLPSILSSFLIISLNRLCALLLPLQYERIFSKKLMLFYIPILTIIPFFPVVFMIYFYDCGYKFYQYGWVFTVTLNPTCDGMLGFYVFSAEYILSIAVFFTDLLTLIVLIYIRRYKIRHFSRKSRMRELSFTKQVLCQGFIGILHGIWYSEGYRVIPGISEQWRIYFTTSFSSVLLHVTSPLCIFLWNLEFQRWIFAPIIVPEYQGPLPTIT